MNTIDHKLTLNNGKLMPMFGLGVFQSPRNETVAAVKTAIKQGYRLIDTAAIYENEREVGQAIKESGIKREELFVTTKLWLTDFGFDEAFDAYGTSLKKLGLDYVDLYLLHWPMPMHWEATLDAWNALIGLYNQGRIGSIGVSNFEPEMIERLIDAGSVVPAVNQVELHPYFQHKDLRDYHAKHGIVTQAWSPLGAVDVYGTRSTGRNIFDNEMVKDIAAAHNKTVAQVILRWHVQHNIAIIPKSVHESRIIENSQITDFFLTHPEMYAIDKLNMGLRGGQIPYENQNGYGVQISKP